MAKIKLYNIDCMEYLKTLEDNAFELAIVDPPYGIGASSNSRISGEYTLNMGSVKRKVKAKNYTYKKWDSIKPTLEYFTELFRVSKNQIIWGGNYFTENLTNSSCWVVWDKKNGANDNADCELAWSSFNTAVRMYKFKWNGMLQEDMKNKEVRIHPTQKPVKLYEWLLMNYANKGDKILDTHLGSGSIAIACHNLNYDLVGCELDTEYYNAACKRLKQHQAQLTIF